MAAHVASSGGFGFQPLTAFALPERACREGPRHLAGVGTRTRRVDLPVLQLQTDFGEVLLSTWEAIRFFYAWTTTLTHRIVSGATGMSLVESLGWTAPSSLKLPQREWPIRLAPRRYRIRLTGDSDGSPETAAMVVLSAIDKGVAAAIQRIQLSLSRPTGPVRYPETLLPESGPMRLEVLEGHRQNPAALGAVMKASWIPPFDLVELESSGAVDGGGSGDGPRRFRGRATVGALTGDQPRRGGARPSVIRASVASMAAHFAQRIHRVPRGPTASGTLLRRRALALPSGSIAFGTSSSDGAVPPRGVATQARPIVETEKVGECERLTDLAIIAADIDEYLANSSGVHFPRSLASLAQVREIVTLQEHQSSDTARTARQRELTIVDVGIGDWAAAVVDLERFPSDRAHELHGIGVVIRRGGSALTESAEIAATLTRTRGRIPHRRNSGPDERWQLIRHPVSNVASEKRRKRLGRRIVNVLLRAWSVQREISQ